MENLLKNRFTRILIIACGIAIGLWGGLHLFLQDLSFETKNIQERDSRDIGEAAKESAESLVPFESASHGFRIHYPKNWEAGEQDGTPFFRLKGAGVNVLYSFDTLSENKTIEELTVSMKEQLTQYYQSNTIPFTFVSEESMRMGGLPAYRLTINYERGGKQITATQALTAQNKRVHIFTLTTVRDQHDLFLPVFLRMMETLSFLGEKL